MSLNEELSTNQIFELSKLIRQIKKESGSNLKLSDPNVLTLIHEEVKKIDSASLRETYKTFLQSMGLGTNKTSKTKTKVSSSKPQTSKPKKQRIYRGQVIQEADDDYVPDLETEAPAKPTKKKMYRGQIVE